MNIQNIKGLPGKKVLIIVENLPLPFDRRVWMESNTLVRNGYEVSIICPKAKGYTESYECINDIHIYRHYLPTEISSAIGYIREYLFALFHEFRLALKIKRKRGFDIIHICNPPDILFLVTLWFKFLYKTKVIFDHHDLNPELFESKFNKRGFFYKALKIAEKLTFKIADHVISTNESYKEVAMLRGKKKESKVTVVRSGPDLRKFQPVEVNKEYKNGKKFLIGYLGVMSEFDGVDHLIDAANIVINQMGRRDIQFCLIGSGPCFDDLVSLTKEYELEDYVEFTGRVSDEELIARLSSCDLCVNPDPVNPLNDKSTMNKIMEYMALGKPIVQYDVLEGKRSAKKASLYALPNDKEDFANKIIDLCDSDSSVRSEMGQYGTKRMIDELEWKHQSKKLIEVYDQLSK